MSLSSSQDDFHKKTIAVGKLLISSTIAAKELREDTLLLRHFFGLPGLAATRRGARFIVSRETINRLV
jgi:hypothetical protein